jgi:hypothetical protein
MPVNRAEQPAAHDPASADLTGVKGIGPARQQWLRTRLGVRTYADLAALNPQDVHARLKEDGQITSLAVIESWIAHAAQLAGQAGTPTPAPDKAWRPFASFVVEFQSHATSGEVRTTVHHMEADLTEKWAGIQQEALCRWMLAQITPPPTQPDPQQVTAGYSERLQQVLRRAASLMGENTRPEKPATPTRAAPEIQQPVSVNEASAYDAETRLKQVIAKADRLTATQRSG